MGRFTDKQKAKEQEELLFNEVEDDKIESLKEAIKFLKDLSDKGKLKTLLDVKVTAEDVQSAVNTAINNAIGEGGAIKIWADANYEAKAAATTE